MSSAQRLGNNMVFSYNKLFIAKLILTNGISYLFFKCFSPRLYTCTCITFLFTL